MHSQILVLVLATFCSHSQAEKNFNRNAVSYIINGTQADISEFPYLVYINHPTNQCGGSLISAEWVVTAAHCINPSVPDSEHKLRLGSSRKYEGGEERTALNITRHEGYLGDMILPDGVLRNDIALIKIEPVTFSATIGPVTLPQQNQAFSIESMAVTAGFGFRYDGDRDGSRVLMKAEVPYLDTEDCKTLMWNRARLLVVPEMQVCFGDLNGGSNICNGDSGGPLMVDGVLVGMSSWGVPGECEKPDSIGVFVRMSYYRDWITQISGV